MDQRKHDGNGFKLKFTRNRAIFIIALSLIAFAALYYQFFVPKPIMSVLYGGYVFNFRADLREAVKVPVYPSEEALRNEMMNSQVKNITIAFKSANDTENPYYILEIYELLYPKLPLAYSINKMNASFNRDPLIVDFYENLTGKAENPIIALVHPVYSNETSITLENHVVLIKGKTHKDFDLAVDKFLMTVLGIEV